MKLGQFSEPSLTATITTAILPTTTSMTTPTMPTTPITATATATVQQQPVRFFVAACARATPQPGAEPPADARGPPTAAPIHSSAVRWRFHLRPPYVQRPRAQPTANHHQARNPSSSRSRCSTANGTLRTPIASSNIISITLSSPRKHPFTDPSLERTEENGKRLCQRSLPQAPSLCSRAALSRSQSA